MYDEKSLWAIAISKARASPSKQEQEQKPEKRKRVSGGETVFISTVSGYYYNLALLILFIKDFSSYIFSLVFCKCSQSKAYLPREDTSE